MSASAGIGRASVPGAEQRYRIDPVDDPTVLFPVMLSAAKVGLNPWLAVISYVACAS